MRIAALVTAAACLAACTPAPAGVPPVPEAGAPAAPLVAAGGAPAAPGGAAAPATAPPATAAPQAREVVITGDVKAPAGVRAPGAPLRALQAAGDVPVANAPIHVLDPATGQVLGSGTTDGEGRYRLALSVTVAEGGKVLHVAVDAVAANGKAIQLSSLTRVDNGPGARPSVLAAVPITLATTVLVAHMMGGAEKVDDFDFSLKDFIVAAFKLELALGRDDFDPADLADPAAVASALAGYVRGDADLAGLVETLAGDEGASPAEKPKGGGGSGGGGSGGGGSGGSDPDPQPTRAPILSGTIQ